MKNCNLVQLLILASIVLLQPLDIVTDRHMHVAATVSD
jgi:hypothetical protein